MAGREAQQAQAAAKEFLFKVLVVGGTTPPLLHLSSFIIFTCFNLDVADMATGKTAIIRRCVEGAFSDNYKTTIGVGTRLPLLFTLRAISL